MCKLRELPIFTFVNKMDRPSLSPFELLDQIEGEFGMKMAPVLWPIGDGERFKVRARFTEEAAFHSLIFCWSPAFVPYYPKAAAPTQRRNVPTLRRARFVDAHTSNPSARLGAFVLSPKDDAS